jgi:HlyD family secretion protein
MPVEVRTSGGLESRNEQNYPIEIICDQTDERLKPKMSAQVEILLETLDNIVYVPIEAVFEKDKQTFCYVSLPEGVNQERLVKTDKNNDDFVAIAEGLLENEKVFLYNPLVIRK